MGEMAVPRKIHTYCFSSARESALNGLNRLYLGICMYIHIFIYAVIISRKRGHTFGGDSRGVYGRSLRRKGKGKC